MLKILKKAFLIITAVFLSAILILSLVARYACGTSLMAMLSSFYMQAVDFNAIYEDEQACLSAFETMRQTNLQDLATPEMSVEVNSRHSGKTQYFTVGESNLTDTLIFYFHGGGFIDQPKSQHWDIIEKIAVQTETPVVVPIYPKVTSYNCDDAYSEVFALYSEYAVNNDIKKIIFIGDSSGGNFALSFAMQLRKAELTQPQKLILISPWMDLSMSNPQMQDFIGKDYMVGYEGLKIIGERWAGDRSIYDPVVSPLYGNFIGLGKIVIFTGEKDMLHPDIMRFCDRLEKDKAAYSLYLEPNLPHVWPLFPTPEASRAFEIIKNEILH